MNCGPGSRQDTTNTSRTNHAGTSKRSATPAHTPAIHAFSRGRDNPIDLMDIPASSHGAAGNDSGNPPRLPSRQATPALPAAARAVSVRISVYRPVANPPGARARWKATRLSPSPAPKHTVAPPRVSPRLVSANSGEGGSSTGRAAATCPNTHRPVLRSETDGHQMPGGERRRRIRLAVHVSTTSDTAPGARNRRHRGSRGSASRLDALFGHPGGDLRPRAEAQLGKYVFDMAV